MNDKNLFDLIKDESEEILKTYRPNKVRAWFTTIVAIIILSLAFVPISIAGFLDHEVGGLAFSIVSLVIFALIVGLYILCINLWLNKTVYAVTTKRILIRTGFIGVDYKSLDFTMLGAFTVNVGLIDKLLKKNTGSLAFGSMASPMVNNQGSKFNFSYIFDPYVTYKEIKAIIEEYKQK